MSRIAILNSGHMDYGGTERVVAFQARGLTARGYNVTIFTPVNDRRVFQDIIPKEVPLEAWWHTLPLPVLNRTINRLLHFWLGGKKLKEFDLLLAHNQPAPFVAYKNKLKTQTPYVVYCHAPWRRLYPREVDLTSGWAADSREKIMFLRESYWRRIDSTSMEAADAFLVNSVKIREEVEQRYHISGQLCYPGIDVATYRDFSRDVAERMVAKYQVDEHTLLIVGRHAPQKRLEWVPEIVNKVALKIPEVKAIVTGKPNRFVTPKLVEKAAQMKVDDKIRLVGSIPEEELISFYHTCPVLVYTAVDEDFGLPPIEAMACGCVPVAWNEKGGPCETIINGKTGLLAQPYEINDFVEKVITLLEHPQERITMAARSVERAKEYDWNNHLNILEKTIEQVMKH